MSELAVLDFETTGMSTGFDRPTEISIAIVQAGRVLDRFESLMNPERNIPWNVQQLTGITNDMISNARSIKSVMLEAAKFVGRRPVVAHNAAFDRRFWQFELSNIGRWNAHPFACTMLISRRLYPNSTNHRLSTLSSYLELPNNGRAHRAMADVLTTVQLLARIKHDLREKYGVRNASFEMLQGIQSIAKSSVSAYVKQFTAPGACAVHDC
jgi:DNA polymerase-3 subunit epsilon